jgi:hypothetical protein
MRSSKSPASQGRPGSSVLLLALAWLCALALACNMSRAPQITATPGGLDATLSAMQSTQTALSAQDAAATPTNPPPPTGAPPGQPPVAQPGSPPGPGSISGRLTFPGSEIPPLRVAAFPLQGGQPYFVDSAQNQGGYALRDLPPGAYLVVAYTQDGKLAGGYSKAVTCGLAVTCSDHSLIPVAVVAGQDSLGIDPIDWYAPPGAFPPPPWLPSPAASPTGSISGELSYPSQGIPPLRVAAFTAGGDQVYVIDTALNQASYQITNLPPGVYHVVAYLLDGDLAGGYTQAVPCGLHTGCTDHSLIDVSVQAGQDTPGIDPGDWYAPQGAFPPRPGQ